ncbi:MAG: hypothetical protein A3D24_04440 [Candidatus Blackburnbacteria bacterium RIFCSPHIGHO2_02_FULL_39_13]|uniref:DUF192 domain-containing protein n=1 Tax=Candidatus Blackburnbacteria bacterium RIFCSPLOWO2_01_FULL_40_20 TaxID=1797519 RepID=A0A1G1VDY2_9BACT|nr:MAG: hypothetical protein A2694_01540 [Candidatus Blackburnbacteria bacterium RIFCSPHIGHO2_01_FULL_40_17]OGY08569.1 MAG: hypothetical protein A3D24_04440 [Candidatus Blackburnbacteria bacterium RIFCSPHIGHO2_02_FULL_39_13]OGY13466.1 MAG: hypothetical protein A3A77_00020 [Candidatus Blackburnbacteria bacterium RIFCSPLOWO2_01_FULL_40_20]OGY15351.1 MAG: hypothetical protein A3I52_02455 [Candidatus Blackburnbacteria bacterium RIFCSPLOWO2_02_FULL_40_10]HBL52403.1 hypothetical protein [Candidatus B
MKIFNRTKKTTISTNAKLLTSFFDKSIGLLKKENPKCLVFKTRFGIHTLGLVSPIDVAILDNCNKVVKLRILVKPNRIFLWNPKYSQVVELPENTIKISKTEIGDLISFEE